ncbi:MAG: hypothetical protein OXG78_15215, partial [Chloroflexi bacterium]|nr:hypothetical protein [Chloroflexota bacterium]
QAHRSGGAIKLSETLLILDGSIVADNRAKGQGNAIYADDDSVITLSDSPLDLADVFLDGARVIHE